MPTHNRLADNWRPLFAVAQVIGGHWPQLVLDAFHALTSSQPHAAAHDSARALLADIRTVFSQSASSHLFSSALVDSLCALPGRPWATLNRQKPITEIWLARRLRSFGIASHILRLNGIRANGYALADFSPTFASLLDGKPYNAQPSGNPSTPPVS